MFFFKTADGAWIPCGPKQPGAVQITMQELAAQGLASQVFILLILIYAFIVCICVIYIMLNLGIHMFIMICVRCL